MPHQIDLNHAGPEELAGISGIDARRAGEIVTYRSEHGLFHSWDEVERVPGIGHSLMERLRAETTLGEAEDLEEEEEEEAEGEVEEEEEAIDEDEVAALGAMANLDQEAAMVYELVAETVDDRELRSMLRSFAQDHRRHVESLDEIVRELGEESPERGGEDGGGLLVDLASTLGALDPLAAVNALIANELLTNGTYDNALRFVATAEAEDVLTRNAVDERRHLEALLEYRRAHGGEEGDEDEGEEA